MTWDVYAPGHPGAEGDRGGAMRETIPAAGVAFGGWAGGHASYSSSKSKPWQNSYYTDIKTKTDYHANGQGGGVNSGAGGHGGNNRNTIRGGGGAPGGGAGHIDIYKIY